MRVLFGMIIGAMVTVGGAFIYDNVAGGSSADGAATARRMVNWDVVEQNWRTVRERAHEAWMALSHKMQG